MRKFCQYMALAFVGCAVAVLALNTARAAETPPKAPATVPVRHEISGDRFQYLVER